MKLLGLSGSVTVSSKTWSAIHLAVEAAGQSAPQWETEVVHLGDYDTVLCDGRNPSDYVGETKELIDKVEEADALIIGTPVYRASLTGALKNLFDLIPNDSLKGKAIGFIATGGSYHHYLVIDHQLVPLAHYFRAHVVPGGVYAHNEHFSNKKLTAPDVRERLIKLGESVVELSSRLEHRPLETSQPSISR
ncbi:NAD(P)H-dependent oxidoreductase [Halobacillus litoralis]|uniref:NADPH-dependent FMN reductase n=1 Tax=Halobacillus litoralis TaxID=45668 RepID=UPI001CD1C728|nr:NAD(P)H-dependent oxidoreductase [Halobacillus litoralis]MCA0972524.1 NAD(P)H-dependent oxidoreductase [Halobacillus litoralis]